MLTIIIGTILNLNTAMRSSLSALVIVMVHEAQQNSSWNIALERMGCVMAGCIIGLLITIMFNFLAYKFKKRFP
jgi:fusaric acid resistance family protein